MSTPPTAFPEPRAFAPVIPLPPGGQPVCKYVIIVRGGEPLPIVWPVFSGLQHVEVATLSQHRAGALRVPEVLGAGLCLPAQNWRCWGESLSLGVHSRGEFDAAILRRHFGEIIPPVAGPDAPAVGAECGEWPPEEPRSDGQTVGPSDGLTVQLSNRSTVQP